MKESVDQRGMNTYFPRRAAGDHKAVETVNHLLLSYGGGPGQGAQGSGTERKGPLSTVAISRGSTRHSPDLVSKVRPDADETLRIVSLASTT